MSTNLPRCPPRRVRMGLVFWPGHRLAATALSVSTPVAIPACSGRSFLVNPCGTRAYDSR